MIYLDNSATTKQYKEVTEIMVKCMEEDFGNPSSMHRLGITTEKIVRKARKQVADTFGCNDDEILFTSGGTESDNTAIFGAAKSRARFGKKIITTKVEHPAVLEACKRLEQEGYDVHYLSVDSQCRVDPNEFKTVMTDDTILATVMTVNNEVGTIQPIKELYEMKGRNCLFHTDAVQAFGKVRVPKVDMISASSHKIHGPKGIGALYIKKGTNIPAFVVGGGQEKAMRSGTENVPAIAGFGVASQIACQYINDEPCKQVKEYLLNGIKDQIKDIKINSPEDGVSNILNVSFLGTRSEVILHRLEESEIYVSAGSACSSHKKDGSHVLKAMGLSDREIEGAIRFSLCQFNTIEEMDIVIDKVKNAVEMFRRLGSYR